MQESAKIHGVDSEKKASQTDGRTDRWPEGQTDGWTDERDRFCRMTLVKPGFQKC